MTFALVLTPLIFTGCSQYPWPSLGHLRWFQVVSALNPMTYVSEGLRGLMVPECPPHPDVDLLRGGHRATWSVLMVIGMIGFRRRALG